MYEKRDKVGKEKKGSRENKYIKRKYESNEEEGREKR